MTEILTASDLKIIARNVLRELPPKEALDVAHEFIEAQQTPTPMSVDSEKIT